MTTVYATGLQAISLQYFGPTERRQARVFAFCQASSKWYNWDHGKSVKQNYTDMCADFLVVRGWDNFPGRYVGGATTNGHWVFVYVEP